LFPIRDLNPTRTLPIVTVLLVVANSLVFLLWQPHTADASDVFMYRYAAIACEVSTGQPLTLDEIQSGRCTPNTRTAAVFPDKVPAVSVFVSMFLHGSIAHIVGNMWFLWLFGNNVEEAFGHVRYLLLYLVAGVVAALAFVIASPGGTIPLVGASGAIAAVLGAYFVLFPGKMVLSVVFVSLVSVPALLFLGLWFVGQFLMGDPGVAWQSHVAGFALGAMVAALFRGPLERRVAALQRRG
jgi:membrane associated rhomboid family serine protease